MEFAFSSERPEQTKTDLLVFFLQERERLVGVALGVDRRLGGHLKQAIADQEFKAKDDQAVLVHTHGKVPARHVALLGIGQPSTEALRRGSAVAVKRAKAAGAKRVTLVLPAFALEDPAPFSQAIAEGAILGDYQFLKYKSEREKKTRVATVTLLGPARIERRAKAGFRLGEIFSHATGLARDLVNEPASNMTPRHIVEVSRKLAQEHRQVKLKIFDQKKLKAMGAGAILGVAKGSDEPPFMIHLSSTPARARKTVALVGKGITFDAGGLNLKDEKNIENMKMDMSGAADILAVFSALPKLKPRVAVHGVIPVCENLPSGKALKPGDVLKTMSGKTIEVLNTDAEGRLILSDGLIYASRLKPDAIIDIATLTGSCMVALGEEVAGAFSTSRQLIRDFLKAAEVTGEPYWELPLVEEYREQIKSELADLQNVAKTKYGGAIMAALFLRDFAGKQPWLHLDIAGPAWEERASVPYRPKGATGFSVRTVLRYLLDQ